MSVGVLGGRACGRRATGGGPSPGPDDGVRRGLLLVDGRQPGLQLVGGAQLAQRAVAQLPDEPLAVRRVALVLVLVHELGHHLAAPLEPPRVDLSRREGGRGSVSERVGRSPSGALATRRDASLPCIVRRGERGRPGARRRSAGRPAARG